MRLIYWLRVRFYQRNSEALIVSLRLVRLARLSACVSERLLGLLAPLKWGGATTVCGVVERGPAVGGSEGGGQR